MAKVVGIDLGTTYSAVAYVNTMGKPEIITNREGERITPSVVLFQGESPLVGSMAKRSAPTAPDDVVQFVKRQMGDPTWRFVTSGDASYSAEQVSSIILKRLKEDAEMALGDAVTDAVITVPAYFDDARRKATMDAGTIAGLNVLRVLNEPTAAALAFGLDHDVAGTVLVYDLGGGTFDVTIMHIADGTFDVKATIGDRNLGGFDWDNELMDHINNEVIAQGGPDLFDDDGYTADLRDKAEMAKRTLTTMAETKVFISAGGGTYTIPVTRAKFEELTAGLLRRTQDLVETALEDASMNWGDIDRMLLVGGSTRMPMVPDLMKGLLGKDFEHSVNPDEAVALGAAIQAALESPAAGGAMVPIDSAQGGAIVVRDVTALGLGTIAIDTETNRERNFVLVPHNSKIPAKGRERFYTVSENQVKVNVQVTEGDDEDPNYVKVVGDSTLSLPPYPQGSPIDVAIAYDIDGIIFAEVFDGVTGEKIGDMEIARESNLDTEQVQQMANEMKGLEVN